MDLAKAMRMLKVHSKKTSNELAEIAGVSKVTMSKWMNGHGHPTFLTLCRICDKCGVKLSTMVSWGEE